MKHIKQLLVFIGVLLVIAACGGQTPSDSSSGDSAQTPIEVQVTLAETQEFSIQSPETTFRVGVPYRFVVTNKGSINHEMMIMPRMMGDMGGMDMEHMDAMALAYISEDKLPTGATQTVEYTFKQPATAGDIELGCYLPGHYEAGMHLPITVTAATQ